MCSSARYSSHKLVCYVLCCSNQCRVARCARNVAAFCTTTRPSNLKPLGCETKTCASSNLAVPPRPYPVAAVEDSATDVEGSTTPDSTDSMAKDVAAPDTTRGPEGTCSPESTDWGADDEVLEGGLKNALGHAERTHKSQNAPYQHQGICPAEKLDHRGTMNPRGPQTRLFVGSKNTSWCQSEQPKV